jgi:hypothetical protein
MNYLGAKGEMFYSDETNQMIFLMARGLAAVCFAHDGRLLRAKAGA